MSKTPKQLLFEWLVKKRFSFTGIGSAVGIVTLFILYSAGIVVEPNFLIYGAFSVIGGALGLGVDEIQNRFFSD
jgi:hypothetical protein